MRIVVIRDVLNPCFTLGKLLIDGVYFCETLEDAVREQPGVPVAQWKIKGETAIPRGTYRVVIDMSTRFKRPMLHLLDVPGYAGIRIHGANHAADVEGCIGVGRDRTADGIAVCKDVLAALQAKVSAALAAGDPVLLEVR